MAPVGPEKNEGSVLLNVGDSKTPAFWEKIRSNRETMTVVACLMFMVCSATMLIVNKAVVKHFTTPVLVVFCQNSMACITERPRLSASRGDDARDRQSAPRPDADRPTSQHLRVIISFAASRPRLAGPDPGSVARRCRARIAWQPAVQSRRRR